jgi:hypothetical protein
VNGYAVEKKVIKETITDAKVLADNGFDVSKVTVTITKVDPTLVKTIGEAEKKVYFNEKTQIRVTKVKVA